MTKRLSIYLPDHLRSALDIEFDGISNRIAAILDRYDHIIRSTTIGFARAEWLLIMDACNGFAAWAVSGELMMTAIALEVEDRIRFNMADDTLRLTPVQARALVAKLQSLTATETMAVVEIMERFWRRHDADADVALAEAGATITDDDGT